MIKLIAIAALGFTFFFTAQSFAGKCDDSDATKDLHQPGSVLLRLSEKVCSKDGKNCTEVTHKDRDYCLNEKTVVKFSCKENESVKTESPCPENTLCKKGACLKE